MVSMEDAMVQAVVQAFLQPVMAGSMPDANGGQQLQWTAPPAYDLARTLYDHKRAELLAKVIAALDVEALARRIADRLLLELAEKPATYGWRSPEADALQRDLRQRVVEKLAEAKAAEILLAQEGGQ